MGWEIDVVASWEIFSGKSSGLEQFVPTSGYRRVDFGTDPCVQTGNSLTALRRRPDGFKRFNSKLMSRIESLDLGSYDLMISVSQHHSAHLVAFDVKRMRPDIPWIAHVSDPWSRNPLVRTPRAYRILNRRLERKVLNSADLITVPSSAMVSFLECDPTKVVVIDHSYVPEFFPSEETSRPTDEPTVVLRHIGSLSGSRSLEPLNLAYDSLPHQSRRRIQLDLVGGRPRAEELTRLTERFDVTLKEERVPYIESLRLMRSADGLVVCAETAVSSPFVPSKIADYVGANRPVLIVGEAGHIVDLGRAYGLPVIGGLDHQEDQRELSRFLAQCTGPFEQSTELVTRFSIARTSDVLRSAADSLITGTRRPS